MMYAGGPGGDPTYGGLLGAAQNYSYPLTGGLLGAAASSPSFQPGQWSQLAYNMAGRPIQGPQAPVAVPALAPGSIPGGGGGGRGSGAMGGLLGAAMQNPGLVKQIGSYLGNGLLGPDVADAASAADTAAISGFQPTIAGTLASDGSAIAAEGQAGLAAQNAGLLASQAPGAVPATAYGADLAAETATPAAADTAAAEGGAASGSTSGALAAALPWAAAALAIGAPIYGAFSAPYSLNSDWYDRMHGYIKAGPGAYANQGGWVNGPGSYIDPQYAAYQEALQALSGKAPPAGGGAGGGSRNDMRY